MPRKLITLLGKAQQNGDYRKARYDFTPHGGAIIETAYIGLALDRHIQSDQLIILGTSASMWDNLFQQIGLTCHEEALLALIEAQSQDAVSAEHLVPLAEAASHQLGKPVSCDIIPYGRNETEQTATISQILSHFAPGDSAILDVTHGLRHLPMLIEQVANLLPTLRNTEIEGIYYGALDLTPPSPNDKTPVMRLDGLQIINQWQNALAVYDYSGNIAVFAPILENIGISEAAIRLLKQAAFAEQTHNLRQSRDKIQNFLALLGKEPDSELLSLIRPTLHQRLSLDKNSPPWHQRFHMAEQALKHKDYLRAALYSHEAICERILEHIGFYSDDYKERNTAVLEYIKRLKKQKLAADNNKKIVQHFYTLRDTRNMLAHGEEDEQIRAILNNEEKLAQTLKDCLHHLKTLTL